MIIVRCINDQVRMHNLATNEMFRLLLENNVAQRDGNTDAGD